MRTHIDWLTFTFTPVYPVELEDEYTNALERGLHALFGDDLSHRAFGGLWQRMERSRAPYTHSWQLGDKGITLFGSPNLNHACVEISGEGCEQLIEIEALNELLTNCADRVTRIDIACDIETNVKPTEFISQLNHERMRSSGYQTSETGETCYIGSKKSDRYARVYRYFPPHPRQNLLRIECVFRRNYAKAVSRSCLNHSIEAVSNAAGDAFGFAHPIWKPTNSETADISISRPERKMGGTVFWLIKSCAPAFKRMCESGAIRDPHQFFNDYFLPQQGD